MTTSNGFIILFDINEGTRLAEISLQRTIFARPILITADLLIVIPDKQETDSKVDVIIISIAEKYALDVKGSLSLDIKDIGKIISVKYIDLEMHDELDLTNLPLIIAGTKKMVLSINGKIHTISESQFDSMFGLIVAFAEVGGSGVRVVAGNRNDLCCCYRIDASLFYEDKVEKFERWLINGFKDVEEDDASSNRSVQSGSGKGNVSD